MHWLSKKTLQWLHGDFVYTVVPMVRWSHSHNLYAILYALFVSYKNAATLARFLLSETVLPITFILSIIAAS